MRILLLLFLSTSLYAQNITNLVVGTVVPKGTNVSNVISSGGGGGSTLFITSGAAGTSHAAFGGAIGFRFTATGQTIDTAYCYVTSGNSATHTIYVFDAGGVNVLGSTTINLSGATSGTYKSASILNIPTTAATDYYVMITDSGDNYTGDGSDVVTTSAAGVITQSCYLLTSEIGNTTPHIVAAGSKSYFGPNIGTH